MNRFVVCRALGNVLIWVTLNRRLKQERTPVQSLLGNVQLGEVELRYCVIEVVHFGVASHLGLFERRDGRWKQVCVWVNGRRFLRRLVGKVLALELGSGFKRRAFRDEQDVR